MPLTDTRIRGLAGLVASLVVGIGLLLWVAYRAQDAEHAVRADRLAVIRARMIADVVERAGGFGDPSRAAVVRVAASDSSLRSVRVVRLGGAMLEASTVPADSGERAAPRRLERPEKWIYDLGQSLQAARTTNVDEGVARKEEIVVRRDAALRLVASPIDRDGSLAGFALVETADHAPLPSCR